MGLKIPRIVQSTYTGNLWMVYAKGEKPEDEWAVCVKKSETAKNGNRVGEQLEWEWSRHPEYEGDLSQL